MLQFFCFSFLTLAILPARLLYQWRHAVSLLIVLFANSASCSVYSLARSGLLAIVCRAKWRQKPARSTAGNFWTSLRFISITASMLTLFWDITISIRLYLFYGNKNLKIDLILYKCLKEYIFMFMKCVLSFELSIAFSKILSINLLKFSFIINSVFIWDYRTLIPNNTSLYVCNYSNYL